MEVVFIELGSYSVKFLKGIVKRKTIEYINFEEKILREKFLKYLKKKIFKVMNLTSSNPIVWKQFSLNLLKNICRSIKQ